MKTKSSKLKISKILLLRTYLYNDIAVLKILTWYRSIRTVLTSLYM